MNTARFTFAATALCAAFLLPVSPLAASETKPGTISVSAAGTANIAPDMAVINLSVVREGKTAREALTANNKAMKAVLDAMKQRGIEERDLQTSNFSIQPRYFYPKPKNNVQQPPKIVGYIVSNALTLRVRDLTALGEIMDEAVTLGVNQGGGISFTNSDPETALTEARKSAMQKAIAKAKTLTEAAGVGLGRILAISENSNQPRPRPIAMARAQAKFAEDAAVPVASGENSYRVTVSVQWEISQ